MTHLGKPILVLLCLSLASGLVVLTRPAPPPADLTVWVFTQDEADTFRQPALDGGPSLIELFRRRTGKSVRVELISQRAQDTRLMSLFMIDAPPAAVPDLVEIDLASIVKYLRPAPADIGLLPLNIFLQKPGELQRIIPSRLTPWSKHGQIYGLPRDVHPVTLTYRKDFFDEAGVDLAAAVTWPQFQDACLKFQNYWAAHGRPQRKALELFTTQSEELLVMLLQRHINLVDDNNGIHLTDPTTIQTVAFYAQLVAGPRRIAADTIPGTPFGYRDLADGSVCAMITPDWRIEYLREFAPELAGKVRMRPLPVFESTDAPTSTWGGSMIGIPRRARDPQAAWQLADFLCLSKEAADRRRAFSDIIPPVREFWSDAAYQSADPYFDGQRIDPLYISLADQIPPRCTTPFSLLAQGAMTLVLNKAVSYANAHGTDGLQDACSGWLTEAADELGQWVQYGDMEK
jgi:arabinosaccharide transport system substrate-binding protein